MVLEIGSILPFDVDPSMTTMDALVLTRTIT